MNKPNEEHDAIKNSYVDQRILKGERRKANWPPDGGIPKIKDGMPRVKMPPLAELKSTNQPNPEELFLAIRSDDIVVKTTSVDKIIAQFAAVDELDEYRAAPLIDELDKEGYTPLMASVLCSNSYAVRALLLARANSYITQNGENAADMAKRTGLDELAHIIAWTQHLRTHDAHYEFLRTNR